MLALQFDHCAQRAGFHNFHLLDHGYKDVWIFNQAHLKGAHCEFRPEGVPLQGDFMQGESGSLTQCKRYRPCVNPPFRFRLGD